MLWASLTTASALELRRFFGNGVSGVTSTEDQSSDYAFKCKKPQNPHSRWPQRLNGIYISIRTKQDLHDYPDLHDYTDAGRLDEVGES
jgi:hypothetical protein